MSLLGGMLAGAATGGAGAVTELANMTLEDRRTKALEKMRFDQQVSRDQAGIQAQLARDEFQNTRQNERDLTQRGYQVEDRDAGFAHATQLASINRSGGGSSINPQVKLMVDTLNGDIKRMSEQLSSGMLGEEESKLLSQQMNQALQQRNQLVGLGFGGDNSSPTNPLLADLMNGGGITDPDRIDTDTPENTPQPTNNPPPKKTGLLGLSQDQVEANPNVQRLVENRESANATMATQFGNFKDRFFNKDMQESEQVAYKIFGERVPLGNPEWEEWLSKNYPESYQRRVERGEIKP